MTTLRLTKSLLAPLLVALTLCACDDAVDKAGQGDLHGTVKGLADYAGSAVVQRLAIAVFDQPTYPPQTMPVAMAYLPDDPVAAGVTFPASYEVGALPAGDLYYMVYGDVDPDDGPLPKTIDPASEWVGPVSITADGQVFEKNVTLEDGRWHGLDTDVMSYFDGTGGEVVDEVAADTATPDAASDTAADLTPKAGRATLHGTVTYAGTKTGKLVVIGFKDQNFDSMPTILPPFTAENATFPYDYVITDAYPTTKAVFAYLDVDSTDGMTNTDKDPVSATATVDLAAGDIKKLDLAIVDP